MKRLTPSQNGSILVALLIMMPFFLLYAAAYMNMAVSSFRIAKKDQYRTHAQFAADAGVDYSLERINTIQGWSGTGSEVQLHNDGKIRTTLQASIAATTSSSKTLTSIGRTYAPANSSTPSSTVKLSINLRPVNSGEYSVVSGVGGLIMTNSAKILGGDVFINGKVSLSNTAQIGLSTSSVNLSVAHNTCPNPANSTYPQLCGSGEDGQPISLQHSSKIYGNVKANNQTNGANMLNPGLTASAGVNAEALPPHDRNAQKAAALTPVAPYNTDWSCNSGTYTWPANLKITGNVTLSNTCKVTVNGDVWITGSLEVRNSAELIVSNSLGTTRPTIMFDGNSAQLKNSAVLRSNSNNIGFQLIAYKSDAGCSPDCANITGTDLANSQGDERILIDNFSSGPNTMFYARWGKVRVNNSGQLGALIGQTVELNNSGTITFGTSTGTGTSYWIINGYRRYF